MIDFIYMKKKKYYPFPDFFDLTTFPIRMNTLSLNILKIMLKIQII